MNDALALAGVRTLLLVAVAVVAVRQLAGSRARRELAVSAWQYVWVAYLADYALAWWHPVAPDVPAAYGTLARPLGLALMLAGIALVVWAYATMGDEWSGSIAVRGEHRVVAEGPFARVRHPVYAGFLLGLFGAALALADPVVALAAAASVPLMRGRALAEERFLQARLGDAYREYRRRVPMFLPRLR